MIYVFYIFAALLVFLSYQSFRGGVEYLRFFRRELARPASGFAPFASVIAPCRGLDDDLEANLSALFRQHYPRYEVIFVVDSERDAAVEVIEKLLSRHAGRGKLVVAGAASGESQKVHNLREAVLHLADEAEVLVFVDSDARPSENWLSRLVAPLEDPAIGAATGYRWFISKTFGFASEMRSVWNASIASALGANEKNNFCWGGSMALRREVFERLGMRERWRGTLSDDFAVTRAMKAEGLAIRFVPQALAASVENCSLGEMLEFTTRQMKITRVYAPHLWQQSMIGAALFNLVWIVCVSVLLFYPADAFAFRFALFSLLLVALFSIGKSWLRLLAVRLVLRDYENRLRLQFWTQNTLWIFSPALFFYNALCALVSRRIRWRGIEYHLISPTETRISEAPANRREETRKEA